MVPVFFPLQMPLIEYPSPFLDIASTLAVPVGAARSFGQSALHRDQLRQNLAANSADVLKSFGIKPLPSEGEGHTFESCRVRE
jgi:hypothetical protein